MKRFGLAILAVVLAHAVTVHAEQWTKTYTISNAPDLRVETTDANIHVDTWDQKTVESDHHQHALQVRIGWLDRRRAPVRRHC